MTVTVTARRGGLRVPEQCGVAKKYSEIEIFVTVSRTLVEICYQEKNVLQC